jgi:hypothetical protein
VERVKEIYRLFKKHQFQLAPLRTFGALVDEEMIAEKRALAERLRSERDHFVRVQEEAAAALAKMPVAAKGVTASRSNNGLKLAAGVAALALASAAVWRLRR